MRRRISIIIAITLLILLSGVFARYEYETHFSSEFKRLAIAMVNPLSTEQDRAVYQREARIAATTYRDKTWLQNWNFLVTQEQIARSYTDVAMARTAEETAQKELSDLRVDLGLEAK
jgi:hypothetical protein